MSKAVKFDGEFPIPSAFGLIEGFYFLALDFPQPKATCIPFSFIPLRVHLRISHKIRWLGFFVFENKMAWF